MEDSEGHEKVYAICENMCWVETLSKEEILEMSGGDTYSREEIDLKFKNVNDSITEINNSIGEIDTMLATLTTGGGV